MPDAKLFDTNSKDKQIRNRSRINQKIKILLKIIVSGASFSSLNTLKILTLVKIAKDLKKVTRLSTRSKF